jgi:hypothetical protein
MDLFILYLLTTIPELNCAAEVFLRISSGVVIISLILLGVSFIAKGEGVMKGDTYKGVSRKLNKIIKTGIITYCISLSAIVIIPNKDRLYLLLGGYAAIELSKVEGVSELPENVVKTINNYLDNIGDSHEEVAKDEEH